MAVDVVAVTGSAAVLLAGASLVARSDPRLRHLLEGLERTDAGARGPRATLAARMGSLPLAERLRRNDRLLRRVALAGESHSLDEVVGWKLLLAVAVPGLLLAAIPGPALIYAGPLLALAAFRLPDLWLMRAARLRRAAIERHLADLVELLVATVEAGLAPTLAICRASEVLHGPISQEVGRAAAEIELGVPWREALSHLANRTDSPPVHRLTATLSRSGRLGGSVRAALRAVASEVRAERRAALEERARRAPVKMLFPLVFMVLPSFLLLTVGPVVMATLRSLQSGG